MGGESSFGYPMAEALREMETALAHTHLHAVGLHVELKQTKQELEKAQFHKERAMHLGSSVANAASEKVAEYLRRRWRRAWSHRRPRTPWPA